MNKKQKNNTTSPAGTGSGAPQKAHDYEKKNRKKH
jgi:hypothetical protein